MAKALVNIPAKVRQGEIIEIKTLIAHPMETGYRTGADGKLVPRAILHRFICTLNGQEVFTADLFPAVAANPFLSFTLRAQESGTLTFRWLDDSGAAYLETATLTVE